MSWTTLKTMSDTGAEGTPESGDFVAMPAGAALVEVRAKNIDVQGDVLLQVYRRAAGVVDPIGGLHIRDGSAQPVILQVFESAFDLAVRAIPSQGTVSGTVDARIVESY